MEMKVFKQEAEAPAREADSKSSNQPWNKIRTMQRRLLRVVVPVNGHGLPGTANHVQTSCAVAAA